MFSSTQLFICGIVILVIGYLVIYGSSSEGFREGLDVPCNDKTNGPWHNAKCSSSGENRICDPKGSAEHHACVDAGIPWIPNTTGTWTLGAGQQQCKTCGKCGPGLDWFKSWKKDPAAPGVVAEICTPTCSKLATMGLCGEDWVLNDDGGFCTADSRWSANCGVGDCQKCGKCRSGKPNADGTCPPPPDTPNESPTGCILPSTLGAWVVPGASPACSGGGTLAGGMTCNVKCDTGYSGSGTTSYSCSSGGKEGTKKWSSTGITPTVLGSAQSSPAVSPDGSVVYVGSGSGANNLYAINATDGTKKWTFTAGLWVWCTPTLSHDGSVVYVGSRDANFYAINAADGTKKWSYPGGEVMAESRATLSHDGSVVYVALGGSLFALNAADGTKKWSQRLGENVATAALSPDGSVLYVGADDYNVHALNAADGTKKWTFMAKGYVTSSPAVSPDGKVVYVGTGSHIATVYAINAADGKKIWGARGAGDSSPALSPDGSVVYVGSTSDGVGDGLGSGLNALNAADGTKKWSFPVGSMVQSSPALSHDGSVVYVGADNDNLYAINATDGTKIWSYKTGGWVNSSPALSPDGAVVYVGALDGNLYAINTYQTLLTPASLKCTSNVCTCPFGTPVTGAACTKDKAELCASCKSGYTLQPDGTCVHNVCTCPGGTAATGVACNASSIHCVTCNPNYHLEGTSCVINKCKCPNGSPATVCTIDGEIKCSACAIGHYLDSNNKCSPNALCSSINACSSGRQFKPNYKQIRCGGGTCKDAECCDPIPQPTCIDFSCPTYSSIIKNAKGKTCAGKACTDDECCTQNPKPTCYGDDIKCPPYYYLKSNAQKIQCSDYTCQSSECCSPNPTCGTMQCAPGFTGKGASTICKGTTCSNTECCTQNSSCSSFACPPDYISNPHPAQAGCIASQCTINECCTSRPPKPPPPHKSTIVNEEEDINIYFPGATFITFDGEKNTNKKQDSNSDIYNYSKYDNWTTPHQTKSYQTNNMFSTIPVNTAATGISAFNTTSYNQA